MRKAFLTTVSAAAMLAVAPLGASAADMLSVGVGGYMQQWFGYANRDDDGEDGGWDAQSDSEVHFKGSLESDMGLKFSIHVELEGDRGSNAIDESFARVSGEFGQIEFGARDHAMVRMHSGISDVGIGLTSGDTQKWVPGAYLETAGHAIGNARKLNYITPRVSGLQVGLSYAPDDKAQDASIGAPNGNDDAAWGAAVNFQQAMGDDATVTISLGHHSRDSADSAISYMDASVPGTGEEDMRLTTFGHTAHMKAWETLEYVTQNDDKNKLTGLTGTDDANRAANLATIVNDGLMGRQAIMKATSSMMKSDASTYTNAGVGVSFGAFKFNVAYATVDGGAYTTAPANVAVTVAEVTAIAADTEDDRFTPTQSLTAEGVFIDTAHTWDADEDPTTAATAEAADSNDPSNDNPMWMGTKVVEDQTKNYDVWGVSVSYTDGPMALSLGHMTHEEDAGGEREATMLSASYTLAPGVAWKSSIFTVEDDTSHKNVTGDMNEGTGFVTGITLGF